MWVSLLLAGLLLPAAASSASAASKRPSAKQASRALREASRLLDRHGASASTDTQPRELSTTLLELSRSLQALPPAKRALASALLARPTDAPDPGGDPYSVPEQPPFCTEHFCVHYVAVTADAPSLADADADGLPDYVEQVAAVAEQSFTVENTNLGWQSARPDGTRGGDARTDVYLAQLGAGLFGYAAPDPGQSGRSQFAYLVLDDDYAAAEFGGAVPLESLQVTFAHEYNHILQYAYDVAQDLWFYEATATWIEDLVYPAINDYLAFVRYWVGRSKLPLTTSDFKIYGSGVLNHWLAGRFGAAVIRRAWERAPRSKPAGFSVNAYNAAIRASGGRDLSSEFARFAIATAEWRTPGVFPYPDGLLYGDVRRRGKLSPRHFVVRRLSHTGYLLLRVRPRHVKRMRLLAGTTRGTRAAFAIVCRRGSVAAGRVRIKLRIARHGGVRGLTLRRPGRCARITAVLVNADPRQGGYAFGDWLYRRDHERFAATLLLRR
jgi:hypothetical protein